ncbi:hypothetical protein K503DRAFT_858436 [Rhizopogon vinicolor AM-OR11-026]|uniref:Uncharacterized protein n=1 Tax=Rhizopogon vinicolor AM-OR11-026 TaxID=1314800 RepID=A0A1B7MSV9_9AGAM|nr:hypothetical protein K503DRAFT_858436 [Rhizopogon vinicolor AM-OR11-026]
MLGIPNCGISHGELNGHPRSTLTPLDQGCAYLEHFLWSIRSLTWCTFERRREEEDVKNGLYSRRDGFCEKEEERLEEHISEKSSASWCKREIIVQQNGTEYE